MAFDFGAALSSAGNITPAYQQAQSNIKDEKELAAERVRKAQEFSSLQKERAASTTGLEQRNKQWVPMRSYKASDGSSHTVYFTPEGLKDEIDEPSPLTARTQYVENAKKLGAKISPEQESEFLLTGGLKNSLRSALTNIPGEGGKPYQGNDGQWYENRGAADGSIVPVPLGANYKPPVAQETPYQKALLDMRKAENDLKNNPNSPMFKLRLQQARTAALNARSKDITAQSSAFGTYNGAPLEGAGESARGIPIGSKFFGGYTKTQQSMAQLNDARGAVKNLGTSLDGLYATGSDLRQPNVAEALATHEWTSAKIAQGLVAGTLTPEEREAVVAIKSAQENIQGMRKAAGGGLSNEQVNRLEAQIPGVSTPNYEYAQSQLRYLNLTLDRLGEGVPATVGGHTMEPSPTAGNTIQKLGEVTLTSGGKSYKIPAAMVEDFKRDHPDAR